MTHVPITLSDEEASATWHGLSKLLDDYWPPEAARPADSWATLCEARRLVEVELRGTGRGELADRLHEEPRGPPADRQRE